MHQFGHHDSMALKWDIGTILLKNATLAIETELMENGGEGGIRTHGTLAGSTVFETAPFDHSGTSPRFLVW